MMVDPKIKKQPTEHRWEVLKDNKIYPIATDDLMVRLWQENRLTSNTSIRRAGEQEWREPNSINWSTFVAMVSDASGVTAAPSSVDTADEAAETTEVAISEESLRAEAAQAGRNAPIVLLKAEDQAPAWWRDEPPTQPSVQNNRHLFVLYVVATLAALVVLVGLSVWSIRFFSPKPTTAAHTQSAVPGSSTATATPTDEPSSETVESTVLAGNALPEQPVAVAPDNASVATANSVDLSVPEIASKKETPSTIATPVEAKPPANQPLAIQDATSPSQPAKVAPAVMPAENQDHRVQDLIARLEASLSVYRETRKEILKCRDEIRKSETELVPVIQSKRRVLAEAENVQLRIKQATSDILSSQLFINNSGGVNSNSVAVQNEKIRLTAFQRELLAAQNLKQHLETQYANIEQQEFNHGKLVSDIRDRVRSITQSEAAALDKFLELMDFFGEKPPEYHRQVFDKTDLLLHEEPDVFYAQVLNSAAAMQLERYDVPRKNLAQLVAHVQSIEPAELELRMVAISRFQALALGLAGFSDWRGAHRESSVKQLDQALKLAPRSLELQLARGMVGTDLKGVKDGTDYFNRAAKINPNDARVYRVGLDSLLASKSPPTQTFPKLLERLLKVTQQDDEPSWLTAAETSIALKKFEDAQQYLKKVHSPMFEQRKNKLQAAIPQS